MTRLAVLWPRPRRDRWDLGRKAPGVDPDFSDAFLFLEDEGFTVTIEESVGRPWNPFARKHEFYSGLDPVRAARAVAGRYDALLCVGDATSFFPFWFRRLRRRSLPILLIDPALSHDYPRRKRLQDHILPKAARVIVYGRCQLDYLRETHGTRVAATFLHHRIDTEFYRPATEDRPEGRPPVVFSIGNDYSRDFDTLAAALRQLAAGGSLPFHTRLQTTRPLPELPPGVEVCREKVSYPELRTLYQQADVVVIALRDMIHAGGINSLLEAMACGRPVVVSGSRGVADYVRHGETAWVVEPGSPAAMAEGITRLLTDREPAARLGANARQFAVEQCSNPIYARRLAAVIRETLSGGTPPRLHSGPPALSGVAGQGAETNS